MTDPELLRRLGLHRGEPIRFRRHRHADAAGHGHWIVGKVAGIAPDGSITLHDPDGSARSLRPEQLEVRRPGARGRLRWVAVTDVAVTWEQLSLWDG